MRTLLRILLILRHALAFLTAVLRSLFQFIEEHPILFAIMVIGTIVQIYFFGWPRPWIF